VAAELLGTGVKDHKVMDQLQQAGFVADLEQTSIKQVFDRAVFLPCQVILLRGFNGAVAQPFSIVASHYQLHGAEERLNKHLLLVIQILADTFSYRYGRAFQFQHTDSDTVDI